MRGQGKGRQRWGTRWRPSWGQSGLQGRGSFQTEFYRDVEQSTLFWASRECLLALLQLDLPLVGADAAAPGNVRLKIGAPLQALEPALFLLVILHLLQGQSTVGLAIGLGLCRRGYGEGRYYRC